MPRSLHPLRRHRLDLRQVEHAALTPAAGCLVRRLLAAATYAEGVVFDAHHVAIVGQLDHLKLRPVTAQLQHGLGDDLFFFRAQPAGIATRSATV